MKTLNAFLREIVSLMITMAVMLLGLKVFYYYVAEPFIVQGHSMDATLQDGERLLMMKQNGIERFDVVVFPSPSEDDKLYIKRVIGVPGDTIEYKDDQLIINGKAMTEPYLKEQASTVTGSFTYDFTLEEVAGSSVVPEGKYFVMGDNRRNSLDGRAFGFINQTDVMAEADYIHWPLSEMKALTQYNLSEDGSQIVAEK